MHASVPRGALAALVSLAAAPHATAQLTTLVAIESDCIAEDGQDFWNDNRLRAYFNPNTNFPNTAGFMKFDTTVIPDGATILSMTLRTFHDNAFGSPFSDPPVRVYRSGDDSWGNNQDDDYPVLTHLLTPAHQGNWPTDDLVPYEWELDVTAADWQVDLADDLLTLALKTNDSAYHYVYFHGANAATAPPELDIEYTTDPLGTNYCGANVNSTGLVGVVSATGSLVAEHNQLTLTASNLPLNQFGYFLNSPAQGFIANPGGSDGNLCLRGTIGRHRDNVVDTGPDGVLSIQLDLTRLPRPKLGPVSVFAGETWNFQCWFHDGNSSNFTDGVSLTFR